MPIKNNYTRRSNRGKNGQCQCSSDCVRPAKVGATFCAYHLTNGCPRRSPLSGSEPNYFPEEYNDDEAVRHSHNCFAYALGVMDKEQIEKCRKVKNCNIPFHSPGVQSGYRRIRGRDGKTCSDTVARTLADSRGGYPIDFEGKCRPGFSKIAAVIDPDADFHYYRQDSNGMWSHKPGAMPVINKDSSGRPIYDPKLAGRNYPGDDEKNGLNYTGFCGFYCVPRDGHTKIASAGGGTRRRQRRKRRSTV